MAIGAGGSINNSATFWVSNGATLDASGAGGLNLNANQALKGAGTVSGGVTALSGSSIYPGADPAIGNLSLRGGLNMNIGASATFDLSALASGTYDQVQITGNSLLSFANNTIHIKAPSTSSTLDTANPYTLFLNNSGNNVVGLPNVTPVFDVAPANAGSGHWLIQPISGGSIVLINSATAPPAGTGSVSGSAVVNGTNIVRNTTITVSATVSGPTLHPVRHCGFVCLWRATHFLDSARRQQHLVPHIDRSPRHTSWPVQLAHNYL